MTTVLPLRLLAFAGVVVFLSACGSSGEADIDQPEQTVVDGGPRVANVRFEGDFLLDDLVVDGEPVTLVAVTSMNFDTEFGGLNVKPGCNTYYGAFSLAEDGLASFSVTGGSSQTCSGLDRQEEQVLQAVGGVSIWTEISDGYRFEGPSGETFTLRR
ncbi:MAG: META domain-containing protein [Acidimicrobiales bacterium]